MTLKTTDKGGRFRPGLWPSIITLIGLFVLASLGTWQVKRLHWKEALLLEIETRVGAPPVDLPASIDAPEDWRYRVVKLEGRYDHAAEMTVAAGRGWHVVTPLLRDGAPDVLVVRGWVPTALKDPATRLQGQVEGEVRIEGILRLKPGRMPFKPDNDPANGVWYWRDFAVMADYAGLSSPMPVFIEAVADAPGGWPRGGVTRLDITNDHLHYAVTWYGLALVLFGIYLTFGLQRGRPGA